MHGYIRRLALISVLGVAFVAGCSPSSGEPAGGTGGSSGAGGSAGRGGSGGSGTTGTGGGTAGSGGGSAGTGGSAGSGGSGGATPTPTPAKDAGAAVDKPGGDSGAATGGPLPPGMRKVYILHDANAGGSANDPSRKSLLDILASMKDSHGIVTELKNSPTKATEMMDGALIIVGPNSSMFGANHPDPGLKTVPIPIIVSKDGNTTEIGLGRATATDPPNFNTIKIIKTDHPLAAGLPLGNLTVLTTPNAQRIITYGGVGPDAIKIAVGPQNDTSFAIVAYEKGGDMGGGVRAPAKRIGFFWHRPAAATADGTKLFKAAVDWALRP
jgi:hypothetical protein